MNPFGSDKHIVRNPSSDFLKLMEMGGVWKLLLEKVGGKAKLEEFVKKWGVPILYWGFSGDSSWCSIGNLGVFIFPLLTNMCYNIIAYIYSIHHCSILWVSYRKLASVGFEPTTTTECWSSPILSLLQFYHLFSVRFHFGYCLHHFKQGWTATAKHGVTRKRSTKRF